MFSFISNTTSDCWAMVNNAPNYALVGHLGIMRHDHIMFSLIQ